LDIAWRGIFPLDNRRAGRFCIDCVEGFWWIVLHPYAAEGVKEGTNMNKTSSGNAKKTVSSAARVLGILVVLLILGYF
jgi:hypothetical protein